MLLRNSSRDQKRTLHTARRRAAMAFSLLLLAAVIGWSGCKGSNSLQIAFKDPSSEPIKAVVRTTVPLAYAASVAMSAVTGSVPPNAEILVNTCTTSPKECSAVIRITDDDSSAPLRIASAGPGTMMVYGYWSTPDQAILTVAFSGNAGTTLFPIHNVSVFPVLKSGSSLKIVYAVIDINATTAKDPATLTSTEMDAAFVKINITASNEASANLDMDAWLIDRNDRGTEDVSDDTYTISGGGQYIEAGSGSSSVLQFGMANAVMGSDCVLNPNAGYAALNEIASSTSDMVLATALIFFHSSCDGTAKVSAAAGNYYRANGESIPLNLNGP